MTRCVALAAVAGFLCAGIVRADEAPWVWPAEAAPELRRIQRELGGSVVEGFAALRSAKPQAAEQRGAVEALREAAAELDVAANRLERFELYEQADGLREQAQRLRMDARAMSDVRADTRPATVVPQPALDPLPTELAPTAAE